MWPSPITVAFVVAIIILSVAVPAPAQQSPLVVTDLHLNGPVTVGCYAAADCTLRNTAGRALSLGRIGLWLRGAGDQRSADGKDLPLDVTPPWQVVPPTLAPGATLSLRGFRKMAEPATYTCEVRGADETGQVIALKRPDGTPAAAELRVLPEGAIPQALLDVRDPRAGHVYRPGEIARLQVTPVVYGGSDLRTNVRALTVTTEARPFSMTDAGKAREMLLAGGPPPLYGFQVDFWGLPDNQRHLDFAVDFEHPAEVSSVQLTGVDLNDMFKLQELTVLARRPDGAPASLAVTVLHEGNAWTALGVVPESVTATGLTVRAVTPYKLNVTSLTVFGDPQAGHKRTTTADATAQWVDAAGKAFAPPQPLDLYKTTEVASPALAAGYAGLSLTVRSPGFPTVQREYGLAALPPDRDQGIAATDPRLGMVHMNLGDANLGVGACKTLTAEYYDEAAQKLDVNAWQQAVAERRDKGLVELPILVGEDWDSDNTKPVSAGQLERLRVKMEQYFGATPDVRAWELGIEETLGWRGNRDKWPSYWANLAAKARVVREAAKAANLDEKLVYQVAELDYRSIEDFCKSPAAQQFDVLALHPYAWPDFPAPEKWLPEFLTKTHAIMHQYNAEKPIWFTEIGAPLDGNPGGFFGYPSAGNYVRGLSRPEHADYLVKCHVLALALGVEKLYWYNYRDGGSDPEYAEHFFGLVDVRGFLKPSYAAYCTMARMLREKTIASMQTSVEGLQAYRLSGKAEDCVVVWAYPGSDMSLKLADLGLSPEHATACDIFGKPLAIANGSVPVTGSPVYIVAPHG